MKTLTFKQHLVTSVACTAIFALIVACAGNGGGNIITSPAGKLVAHLFHKSQPGAHSHLVPISEAGKPILATLFFPATASTASDIPESFEVTCDFPTGFIAGVPAGSIVPFVPNGSGTNDPNNCSFAVSQPQPGLSGAQPVFHAGTLQTLVVTGVTAGGAQVRCSDLTSQSAVADQDFVVPYLNPQTNAVLMFNNVTQLGFNCLLAGVPTGDPIARLTARWAKL
jgi:hypothetical protein